MPRWVSDQLKAHAASKILDGEATAAEASSKYISTDTIRRAMKDIKSTGDVRPHKKASGRPSKLPPHVQTYILAWIRHHPTTYQDELVEIIKSHFDIAIHQSTISRFLDRAGYSYKLISAQAAQRREDDRLEYILAIADFTPEQLIFADESHFNQRTNMRPRGWSRIGERAIEYRILVRGERYSLLPGLSIDGIVAPWAFRGSVNTVRFHGWVRDHLLPRMTPYPGPRSVLVLDNCVTHKSPATRALVEEAGCKLVFLPAYSPDFNPIELAFASIKRYLKRHPANHEFDLIRSSYEAVNADHAAGFFRCGGYEQIRRVAAVRAPDAV
ncbi:hypothetical protein CF319_g6615 [Tilletia indica]|uniref:Uncharacterized protein n=1 Tax=Tilletia indica TaxID=43049 RepID=A0A177TS98_9BASI|nr:hypothetical protein CF319_g6615 [Tilletia indica]KAE8250869.1 hypothetical protein A4X13_0g4306 [Tilletia indica]